MYLLQVLILAVLLSFIRADSNLLCNDLNACDRFVPWANLPNANAKDPFQIHVNISHGTINQAFNVQVDTGSTGFLYSAKNLGYATADDVRNSCGTLGCDTAFEYLSSSKIYYDGYWIPSTLTFNSSTGKNVVSRVSILAVTEKGICSTFTNGNCARSSPTTMPTSIAYMGVGFGRWSAEQPGATADHNPFLNVDLSSGSNLQNGYIVNDQGVILGIGSNDITQGWKTTQLSPNTASGAPTNRTEWQGTPMCVAVAGSQCFPGTALFDTGIDYSFLGVPSSATQGVSTSGLLNNGTSVTVQMGVSGNYVDNYTFKAGDFNETPQLTPSQVKIEGPHPDGAFINTGRYFYNGFGILFREKTGIVGFRHKTWGSGGGSTNNSSTSVSSTSPTASVTAASATHQTGGSASSSEQNQEVGNEFYVC